MKKLFTIGLLSLTSLAFAGTNLSDAIDKNEVPAELEEREEEVINRPDAIDDNKVPAPLEEREKEEEWRDSYEEEQFDTKELQNKQR